MSTCHARRTCYVLRTGLYGNCRNPWWVGRRPPPTSIQPPRPSRFSGGQPLPCPRCGTVPRMLLTRGCVSNAMYHVCNSVSMKNLCVEMCCCHRGVLETGAYFGVHPSPCQQQFIIMVFASIFGAKSGVCGTGKHSTTNPHKVCPSNPSETNINESQYVNMLNVHKVRTSRGRT